MHTRGAGHADPAEPHRRRVRRGRRRPPPRRCFRSGPGAGYRPRSSRRCVTARPGCARPRAGCCGPPSAIRCCCGRARAWTAGGLTEPGHGLLAGDGRHQPGRALGPGHPHTILALDRLARRVRGCRGGPRTPSPCTSGRSTERRAGPRHGASRHAGRPEQPGPRLPRRPAGPRTRSASPSARSRSASSAAGTAPPGHPGRARGLAEAYLERRAPRRGHHRLRAHARGPGAGARARASGHRWPRGRTSPTPTAPRASPPTRSRCTSAPLADREQAQGARPPRHPGRARQPGLRLPGRGAAEGRPRRLQAHAGGTGTGAGPRPPRHHHRARQPRRYLLPGATSSRTPSRCTSAPWPTGKRCRAPTTPTPSPRAATSRPPTIRRASWPRPSRCTSRTSPTASGCSGPNTRIR